MDRHARGVQPWCRLYSKSQARAAMKTHSRLPNHQLVKTNRTYSIAEVARLFGICRHTVRRWIGSGLKTIDDQRPILILGLELRRFVQLKRSRNKRPCQPGEMYCFKCRMPRRPSLNAVSLTFESDRLGRLMGDCSTCGTVISRLVSPRNLKQVCGDLIVTLTPAQSRIDESGCPGLSVHFVAG